MLYTVRFFSSKCSLFHNANFFGSCNIHILYTGCAKIKKIIPAPKDYSWYNRTAVHQTSTSVPKLPTRMLGTCTALTWLLGHAMCRKRCPCYKTMRRRMGILRLRKVKFPVHSQRHIYSVIERSTCDKKTVHCNKGGCKNCVRIYSLSKHGYIILFDKSLTLHSECFA